MKHRQMIRILCIIFGIGIVAILGGIMMYIDAPVPAIAQSSEQRQMSPQEQPAQGKNTSTDIPGYDLSLLTTDLNSGMPLGNVSVYIDGGYERFTSAQNAIGILDIGSVSEGQRTIRATKTGYMDYAQSVVIPAALPIKIDLQAQLLVPVQEPGSHNSNIDIVFIPSSTTYNCAEQKKIYSTVYVTNKSAFVSDVHRVMNESLFTLDTVTDKTDPIPADYRERFNIYYYYNTLQFADAFNGCAGTIPDTFWETVPFVDIVVILYPTYYTPATGAPCEPNGCVKPGTGQTWMKIPADQNVLFLHESGHALFGLIDTYCSDTEYWQNDPVPNVWSSQENCVNASIANSWDSSACRQIKQTTPNVCIKQFWKWDPEPDIMQEGYSGTFGKASTLRITYTLNNIDAWGRTV